MKKRRYLLVGVLDLAVCLSQAEASAQGAGRMELAQDLTGAASVQNLIETTSVQEEAGSTSVQNLIETASAQEEAGSATAQEETDSATAQEWTEITLAQDASTVSGDGASVSGNVVSITEGGNYRLTGELTDGQIYIEADKKDDVTLSLNGVSVTNRKGDAIHVEQADKVTLVLEDGTENTATSGSEVTIDENAEPQSGTAEGAAIYSRDDLEVEGSGSLAVYGYLNNGLHTTNDLTISSGTLDVTAVNNGLKGKDSVTINDGTISVHAGGDGIQSDDETGEGYGVVHILGGTILVECYGDGIFAQTQLTIEDGTVAVARSTEALEANQIAISGGTVGLRATDDGINAFGGTGSWGWGGGSQKTTQNTPNLLIEGGTVLVDADGDGLDSNGNIDIEGGTIIVNGPTNSANGAIDSGAEMGGTCVINGGTLLALGSAGMAESFDAQSGQCSFLCNLQSGFQEGAKITVTDADGVELFSYEAEKSGSSVVFSSPDLVQGETYTLFIDDQATEVTLDGVSTVVGGMGNIRGGFGGPRGGMGGLAVPDGNTGNFSAPDGDMGNFGAPDGDTGSFGAPDGDTGSFGTPDGDMGNFGTSDGSMGYGHHMKDGHRMGWTQDGSALPEGAGTQDGNVPPDSAGTQGGNVPPDSTGTQDGNV